MRKPSQARKPRQGSPAQSELRFYRIEPSPIGPLTVVTSAEELLAISFGEASPAELKGMSAARNSAPRILDQTCQQLREYFAGKRQVFDLHVAPQGTAFQRKVWQALTDIPFGATASYLDIATATGNPKACRAVGAANGRNPIPIVIPCHRVIGTDGSLTGFAGGLGTKVQLLEIEGWQPDKANSKAGTKQTPDAELSLRKPTTYKIAQLF